MPTVRPTAIPGQLSTHQPAAAGAIHRGRRMRQKVYAYRSYRRPPGSVIAVGSRSQRRTQPRRVQRAYRLRRHRNACPETIRSIVQHDLSTLEPGRPSPARFSHSKPAATSASNGECVPSPLWALASYPGAPRCSESAPGIGGRNSRRRRRMLAWMRGRNVRARSARCRPR
jgi:hypothetical protein